VLGNLLIVAEVRLALACDDLYEPVILDAMGRYLYDTDPGRPVLPSSHNLYSGEYVNR
jgi:hypothetical protein